MRLPIVWTIFRKEITESLRDRLTLAVVVGLPVLLYPLMIMGLGKLQESRAATQEERVSKVAVWGEPTAGLLDRLVATNKISLATNAPGPRLPEVGLPGDASGNSGSESVDEDSSDREKLEAGIFEMARDAVTERKLDAVLIVWPGFSQAIAGDRLGRVSICFDSVRPASEKSRDRLRTVLGEFRRNLVSERERSHGLSEGFASGIEIRSHNLAPPKRQAGQMLGQVLPFIIIMLSATGALYASIDLTAGEKDRATMQTLLCAPVHNLEIVAGKFLTIWCVSLIASLANAASIGATIWRAAASASGSFLNLSPGSFVLAFLLLLPATFTISSFFMAVAMMARDAKDAGNFLGASMTLIMVPMAVVLMPGVDLNPWTAFVPLVNVSLLIKSVFLGEARPDAVFLTLLSALLYASLAITMAARAFGREQILLGGGSSFSALFRRERKQGARPTPTMAFLTFALIMVLTYYGSLLLKDKGIITSLLVTQYAFFLIPVTAVVLLMRYPSRDTFSFRPPPWRGVIAAILFGVSAWAAVGGLVVRLLPPPDSLVKALEKVVMLENAESPLWLAWLVVGVTPALCEELLFRGLILSGLRRLGNWPALLLSSLLFAVAHASIYRLLPTFFLGMLLGYVVLRTGSIFCSMIIHMLNNGLAVTLARSPSLTERFHLEEATYVPWSLTLPAVALVIIGFVILGTQKKNPCLSGQDSES